MTEAQDHVGDEATIEIDSSTALEKVLAEVAEWKLEAKNEDNHRYFFHVREVAAIENGKRAYVIGRKGSGKTAISEYLGNISDHETFSKKLTFKNFPFNALYALVNKDFPSPNQYITLWTYVIYSTICQMMLQNNNISVSAREKLDKVFGDSHLTLDRRIGKWTAKEFHIGVLGVNFKVGGHIGTSEDISWIQRVDILGDFISENIDKARYFIIFDELDEDYRDVAELKKFESYTALITGLFKAVQGVKAKFKENNTRIMPIVFLRDDIYSLMDDSDKTKWGDFKIDLTWDERKARELVAFRLTRAFDADSKVALPFDEAWRMLIGTSSMRYGTQKKSSMDSFSYIARSTYLRPRDFVKYLQECALRALESGNGKINSDIVYGVDTAFSSYLKDELRDEIFAVIPEINGVFDAITQIGKWNFSYSEFHQAYKETVDPQATVSTINFCLQVLFIFSVIGTALNHSYFVFKYAHKDGKMNYKNRIIVHRGLFKALQIV